MKKTASNRNLLIDIWRIIAALLIVMYHTRYLNLTTENYHFHQAYLYVEFYFLLSGYFAYVHFHKCSCKSVNEMAGESIRYTVKKWSSYLPYVIPAVIAQYILEQILSPVSRADFLHILEEMPRDLFLLSAASGKSRVGPLWYLSAMILVMPLLGMLFQYIPKYLMLILSILPAMIYYGLTGASGVRTPPHDLIRAMVCMMLGVLIFCLLEELNRLKFRKLPALLLGEGLLIYTVISTWSTDSSTGYGKETVVLAFLGGIVLLLCHGDIRLPAPARGLIKYACDLSFVMYIWQKGAATIVDILIPEGSDHKKVIIYCAVTAVVSVIMKFLTEQLTALMKKAAPGKYFFEK